MAMRAPDWSLVAPRARVIVDNDYSGDPDDLIQTAHHLLSPSVEIPFLVASHLSKGDPWDPSEHQARNAEGVLNALLDVMALTQRPTVLRGAETALENGQPHDTPAARAIIAEAMREDTELPLYFAAGAGLTELASALLLEPEIAERMTLIWIGGPEHAGIAVPPPGADPLEYNLRIDIEAARIVFAEPRLALWQVPRDAYRSVLMSYAELVVRVGGAGRLGAFLRERIERVFAWTGGAGLAIGETYAMGDSPLVTLTALQSAFQPDPASSPYRTVARPTITTEGGYGEPVPGGGTIRVYQGIDTRLTFEDFYAKLALWQAANP